MKVQFSVQINTHQPRDCSKCSNLNFNTNHKGEIQPLLDHIHQKNYMLQLPW